MAHIDWPQINQVWLKDGNRRKVVEVAERDGHASVGWQRPGNDWRTSYVLLKTWSKWAANAQVEQSQVF